MEFHFIKFHFFLDWFVIFPKIFGKKNWRLQNEKWELKIICWIIEIYTNYLSHVKMHPFISFVSSSKGQHYIYKVLDWSKPGKAFGTFGLTLILAIFVHIALFALYKLRVYVQRRYFSHAYVITEIERQTTDDKLEPEMTILDLQYLWTSFIERF